MLQSLHKLVHARSVTSVRERCELQFLHTIPCCARSSSEYPRDTIRSRSLWHWLHRLYVLALSLQHAFIARATFCRAPRVSQPHASHRGIADFESHVTVTSCA